jgi:hypothetical protein
VAPLERRLVLLQENDPEMLLNDLAGGLYWKPIAATLPSESAGEVLTAVLHSRK